MPPLKAFEKYVHELEALTVNPLAHIHDLARREQITAALDGGTSAALRRIIPVLERRKIGAFFTPSELAIEALEFFNGSISADSVFLDLACGAGDLLIAVARLLPIDPDFGKTLSMWGRQLIGFDLQPEFIRAAKARLVLLAQERGAKPGSTPIPSGEELFPLIRQGNGLDQVAYISLATHIILNPPFPKSAAPDGCGWAGGKVSLAAVFMDLCVSHAHPGTKIVAILPDVLRSGSFYKKWRGHIISKACVEAIKVIGQFDTWTDVDVFMLHLCVGTGNGRFIGHAWWQRKIEHASIVSDLFEVQVGRVVPYRDPEKGPSYPYIYSRVLPPWEVVRAFTHHRRFSGNVFKPPFVAVRRTSRPGHEYRAVGTIICGREMVAVENHLIVLKPKDRLVRTCRKLLGVLQAPQTSEWLDNRIRCRHLTVPAVREIPW
jgi:SAM-dependent methyltransferase